MNTHTQAVTIDFHGQPMIAIKNGDEIHVAMKPICESIGIDWRGQRQRIKRHPVLSKGVCVMNTPSEGGDQETTTLPLKMLNGWLFGIDAGRVKPECRPKLVEYQTECFDVLANYFLHGEAINPRTPYTVGPNDTLSSEQADTLRQMLTEVVGKLPADKRKGFMVQAWSKLKSHFKVGYRHIPAAEFSEAASLVARHIGEFIAAKDATPALPAPVYDESHIKHCATLSNIYGATVSSMIFNHLLANDKDAIQHERFLVCFDAEMTPHAKTIEPNAVIAPLDRLAQMIVEPNGMCPSNADLANLAAACNQQLAQRMNHPQLKERGL